MAKVKLRLVPTYIKSVRIQLNPDLSEEAAGNICHGLRDTINRLSKSDFRKGGFPNSKGMLNKAFKAGCFIRFKDWKEREKFIAVLLEVGGQHLLDNCNLRKTIPNKASSKRFRVMSA